MIKLDFPNICLKTKIVDNTTKIFDVVRKKYFIMTKEEYVRQHFIHYLNKYKSYPLGLMAVEKKIIYNNMNLRADLIIYNNKGYPIMIIECKAHDIELSQDAFNQLARYNYNLKVPYLVVTNGIKHFCCTLKYENREVRFLNSLPNYNDL